MAALCGLALAACGDTTTTGDGGQADGARPPDQLLSEGLVIDTSAPADAAPDVTPREDAGKDIHLTDSAISDRAISDGAHDARLDGALDVESPDMQTADQQVPDLGSSDISTDGAYSPDFPWPPTNYTCAGAYALTLVAGHVTVEGDTTWLLDEYPTLDCGFIDIAGNPVLFDGPQAYYVFEGKKDQWYAVTATRTAYVFTSGCSQAQIEQDCTSAGASGDITRGSRSIYFRPAQDGPVYVAVDGRSISDKGPFTLSIDELAPPSNATCAGAASLTFVDKVARAQGDLDPRLCPDEYPSLSCQAGGPQLYYHFNGKKNVGYRIFLQRTDTSRSGFYVARNNCDEAALAADCESGTWGDIAAAPTVFGARSFTVQFVPPADGEYLIAVEGGHGHFWLEVEEDAFTVPPNFRCADATQLSLASGVATASGTTVNGLNEYGTAIRCIDGATMSGMQAYYRFDARADRLYAIEPNPNFLNGGAYIFRSSACGDTTAINNDCGSDGVTGIGTISLVSGANNLLLFAPTVSDSYTLAIDNGWTSSGTFELRIEELPRALNDSCKNAAPLSFVSGHAHARGYTVGMANEFPAGVSCGSAGAFNAGQAYHSADLLAGHTYVFRVASSFDIQGYLFRLGNCRARDIEADCSGDVDGTHWATSFRNNGQVVFTPRTSGTYVVAIDGRDPTDHGAYDLHVHEVVAAPTFIAPFKLDFEISSGGLHATRDWEWGKRTDWFPTGCLWRADTQPINPYSGGQGVWGTVLDSCYSALDNGFNCVSRDPQQDSVLSFKVTLDASWSSATLQYWDWLELDSHDSVDVYVGGQVVDHRCSPSVLPHWRQRTVDLSPHIGSTVEIAFHLSAGASGAQGGWYLDDIEVVGQ